MVVPKALRVLRLAPGRKFTVLKRLSHEMGWKYQDVVEKLEEKRKVKSQAYYEKKKSIAARKTKAALSKKADIEKVNKTLVALGH